MTPLELAQTVEPLALLDTAAILQTLLLALGLGLAIALTYRASVPGRVLSPVLQASLILLAMIAALVLMVIGNNIARAFSLVGALAIVRFRTRLQSPWDITFVFLSLAVGIACGVEAHRVAVVGTAVLCLTVLALQALPLSGIRADRLRNLRCDVAAHQGVTARLEEILDRRLARRWLLEAKSLRFGESLSFLYRVVVRDGDDPSGLLLELGTVEGVERVVLDLAEEASEDRE